MDSELASMLVAGLNLMLIGMGIVFSFLLLLVWLIQRTHRLLLRLEPPAPNGLDATATPKEGTGGTGNDGAIVAAIVAAIHRHENRG